MLERFLAPARAAIAAGQWDDLASKAGTGEQRGEGSPPPGLGDQLQRPGLAQEDLQAQGRAGSGEDRGGQDRVGEER